MHIKECVNFLSKNGCFFPSSIGSQTAVKTEKLQKLRRARTCPSPPPPPCATATPPPPPTSPPPPLPVAAAAAAALPWDPTAAAAPPTWIPPPLEVPPCLAPCLERAPLEGGLWRRHSQANTHAGEGCQRAPLPSPSF